MSAFMETVEFEQFYIYAHAFVWILFVSFIVTFILLTCLLIFLESFPKQGGVIGTRDFGFAGADL